MESPWTTKNEIKFLDYLESASVWSLGVINEKPSIDKRIKALRTWLRHAESRIWPQSMDIEKCIRHANGCLVRLGG